MQKKWNNISGRPLSSSDWLQEHHIAKLPERIEFIKKLLIEFKPRIIVDLGCGIGLWLELFKDYIDKDCELIGIDSDKSAIDEAVARSKDWSCKVSFIHCDFIKNYDEIPSADLYLAFNIFSYIEDAAFFIQNLNNKLTHNGKLAIRQYDGAAIRFGPMEQELRLNIENVLFNSVNHSAIFKHYNLDRTYEVIQNSGFKSKNVEFELFHRSSPYPKSFLKYYQNTIKWTINYLSDKMSKELEKWYFMYLEEDNFSYFYEVDLTAILTRE